MHCSDIKNPPTVTAFKWEQVQTQSSPRSSSPFPAVVPGVFIIPCRADAAQVNAINKSTWKRGRHSSVQETKQQCQSPYLHQSQQPPEVTKHLLKSWPSTVSQSHEDRVSWKSGLTALAALRLGPSQIIEVLKHLICRNEPVHGSFCDC